MAEIRYDLFPGDPESIKAFIERGRPLGSDSFMENVVCNDLFASFRKADDINRYMLPHIVTWFYSHAPIGCYGSREKYKNWVNVGGLDGLAKLQDQETTETDV